MKLHLTKTQHAILLVAVTELDSRVKQGLANSGMTGQALTWYRQLQHTGFRESDIGGMQRLLLEQAVVPG